MFWRWVRNPNLFLLKRQNTENVHMGLLNRVLVPRELQCNALNSIEWFTNPFCSVLTLKESGSKPLSTSRVNTDVAAEAKKKSTFIGTQKYGSHYPVAATFES